MGPDWRGAWALAEVWAAPVRCRCGWGWARPRRGPRCGLAAAMAAVAALPRRADATAGAIFARKIHSPVHLHAHPHVSRKALLQRAADVRRPPAAPPAPAALRCGPALARCSRAQGVDSVGRAHARQRLTGAGHRTVHDRARATPRRAPRAGSGNVIHYVQTRHLNTRLRRVNARRTAHVRAPIRLAPHSVGRSRDPTRAHHSLTNNHSTTGTTKGMARVVAAHAG